MAKKKISEFPNKATPVNSDLFLIEQADGTYYNVLKSSIAGTGYTPSNDSLSNLTTTSINQNLIPQSNGVQEIGADGIIWANGFFDQIKFDSTANIDVQNRLLRNSNGSRVLEYEESKLNDKDGLTSIDAHNRILKGVSGDSLDYSNNSNVSVNSDFTAPGTIYCDASKSNSVQLQGTNGIGFVELQNQISPVSAPTITGWRQYITNLGAIAFKNGSNRILSFNTSAMTGDVDLSVGNTTGIIAVTSYVDAKVQNSLTASTTIAPSTTAVNTALSGKLSSVTGTTNRVTITGGSTIDIASTYVGQSSITTLGTITTGVWNGTAIANANLANSSMTINGTAISLGASGTITAAAGTLTGTTLNATVVSSSLTSVGTITAGVWNGTSIGTTYTDAKIKGTIGATSGLIAIGTGTADTVTTLTGFSYTASTFLANPSTSTQITIGSTATNAMFRLDSVGGRIGNLSTAGTTNTVSFQVGTKFFITDSSSMVQLGTASTGQFQMQTSFFGSGSGVLSTIGSFMGGNGTRGSMAFAPSADLANAGDKVLFAYHTGSAWASALEYANASAANVIVSLVGAGGRVGIATASSHSTLHVNGSFAKGYVAKTGAYTATINDSIIDCTSGTFTVTLPTAVGISGRVYEVTNSGAGTITVGTTSSQTFVNVAATPTTLTVATSLGKSVRVMSNGANWIQLN